MYKRQKWNICDRIIVLFLTVYLIGVPVSMLVSGVILMIWAEGVLYLFGGGYFIPPNEVHYYSSSSILLQSVIVFWATSLWWESPLKKLCKHYM